MKMRGRDPHCAHLYPLTMSSEYWELAAAAAGVAVEEDGASLAASCEDTEPPGERVVSTVDSAADCEREARCEHQTSQFSCSFSDDHNRIDKIQRAQDRGDTSKQRTSVLSHEDSKFAAACALWNFFRRARSILFCFGPRNTSRLKQ